MYSRTLLPRMESGAGFDIPDKGRVCQSQHEAPRKKHTQATYVKEKEAQGEDGLFEHMSLHQLSTVNSMKVAPPGRRGRRVTPAPSIAIFPSLSSQRLICLPRPPRSLRLIIPAIGVPAAAPPDTPSVALHGRGRGDEAGG